MLLLISRLLLDFSESIIKRIYIVYSTTLYNDNNNNDSSNNIFISNDLYEIRFNSLDHNNNNINKINHRNHNNNDDDNYISKILSQDYREMIEFSKDSSQVEILTVFKEKKININKYEY